MTLTEEPAQPVRRVDPTTRPVDGTRGFRSDIQALRAAAVSLVVLNHLWPTRVPGGYIGVDIFFVISGYLITAHLRREVDSAGRVDLAAFWTRRARRLLPAAFTTLLFAIAATVIWAPLTTWQGAMEQIAAAATYRLNWALAASSLDYFAPGNAGSAVMHYWSLSVEEQFYLVWPLLITAGVLVFRRSKRWQTAFVIGMFAMVAIASFVWALHSVRTDASVAYFETTGRAWQFAAGGLLTFVRRPGARARTIPLTWIAWFVIGLSGLRFGPGSGLPGWRALAPVLATAVIIWVGDVDCSWGPGRLTSLGPVQFIGGISYSLYLWHWPLVFLAPMVLERETSSLDRVVVLLLSVVLAYMSKRYIEDPVRMSRRPFAITPRWALATSAASMVILLVATWVTSATVGVRISAAAHGLYDQSMALGPCFGAQAMGASESCSDLHILKDPDFALVDVQNQIKIVPNGTSCISVQGDPVIRTCSFGAAVGTQMINVALIGDSHAEVWVAALAEIAMEKGLRVTTYLENGCPPALDDRLKYAPAILPKVIDGCRRWRNAAVAAVANDASIDVVVTASKDKSYVVGSTGSADPGDGYLAAWKIWIAAGKKVVAIDDVPDHRRTIVPTCIATSKMRVDPCAIPAGPEAATGPLSLASSRVHSAAFAYVEFWSVFCDSTLCHAVIGGIPAYIDSSHLTAAFARSFSPRFKLIEALTP